MLTISCERPVLCVLVADDHELTQYSLKLALENHLGIELIGIATNGLEAINCVRECMPSVVILDVQMPVVDGLTAAGEIKNL